MRIEVEKSDECPDNAKDECPNKDKRAQVWRSGEIPHRRSSIPKLIQVLVGALSLFVRMIEEFLDCFSVLEIVICQPTNQHS